MEDMVIYLESVIGKFGIDGLDILVGLDDGLLVLDDLDSSGVPFSVLGDSLGLEVVDKTSLSPAALSADVSNVAVFGSGLESDGLEGVGDDDLLLGVEGKRYSVEALESAEGSGTLGGLMGEHASDDSPDVSRGGFLVNGALLGVGTHSLSKEVHEL